jgi:hypothetical protein
MAARFQPPRSGGFGQARRPLRVGRHRPEEPTAYASRFPLGAATLRWNGFWSRQTWSGSGSGTCSDLSGAFPNSFG